ncbi:MAG TPA: tetratricopeptide repeat protein, partial [Chthoniobacterales bacterium]
MNQGNFFAELKRRNVIRMAGLYLVAAWLLTQVASTVLPMFGAPEWLPRTIVILLAIGFIPALIFSWVFEVTSEGLKRDEEVAPEKSIAPQTGRRMDRMIIAVLGVALGYFAFDKFVLAPRPQVTPLANDSASAPNAQSIAVLPFVNMTSDREQEYFSDGLSEELLNQLAQIPQLRVIARTSSFSFKGKEVDVATIAKALNVANVLEGSVRKSATTLRITAQLIRASDSSHLWSKTYDRPVTDVFKVQDEIARDVVATLKVKLLPTQELAKPQRTANPEAYQQYLQGRFFINRHSEKETDRARAAYERAAQLDPNFALAWAGQAQCHVWYANFSAEGGLSGFNAHLVAARAAVARALSLEPDLPDALLPRAMIETNFEYNWKAAAETLRKALLLAPQDPALLEWAGNLAFARGEGTQGVDLLRQAVALDPVNAQARVSLAGALLAMRNLEEARRQYARVIELNPSAPYSHAGVGATYLAEGKFEEAATAAQKDAADWARLLIVSCARWEQKRFPESDTALADLIAKDSEVAAYQIAEAYAYRNDKDHAFEWLERARQQRDAGLAGLRIDTLLPNLHDDPR